MVGSNGCKYVLEKSKRGTSKVDLYRSIRLGEEGMANNGQKMKIVGYNNSCDISVEFEDGTVVSGIFYSAFKHGKVRNPNFDNRKKIMYERIGEERLSVTGQKMKIIEYKNFEDIDVEFEDGTVVYHRSYNNFKKGSIRNPNSIQTRAKLDRIGEERVNREGIKLKIIAYFNKLDISVQSEDGIIVEHVRYDSFLKGTIKVKSR